MKRAEGDHTNECETVGERITWSERRPVEELDSRGESYYTANDIDEAAKELEGYDHDMLSRGWNGWWDVVDLAA